MISDFGPLMMTTISGRNVWFLRLVYVEKSDINYTQSLYILYMPESAKYDIVYHDTQPKEFALPACDHDAITGEVYCVHRD